MSGQNIAIRIRRLGKLYGGKKHRRDSGLSKKFPRVRGKEEEEEKKLDEELKRARQAGDFDYAKRIQREMKNRGFRNKNKNRKGPRMRGLFLVFEILRRIMEEKED